MPARSQATIVLATALLHLACLGRHCALGFTDDTANTCGPTFEKAMSGVTDSTLLDKCRVCTHHSYVVTCKYCASTNQCTSNIFASCTEGFKHPKNCDALLSAADGNDPYPAQKVYQCNNPDGNTNCNICVRSSSCSWCNSNYRCYKKDDDGSEGTCSASAMSTTTCDACSRPGVCPAHSVCSPKDGGGVHCECDNSDIDNLYHMVGGQCVKVETGGTVYTGSKNLCETRML